MAFAGGPASDAPPPPRLVPQPRSIFSVSPSRRAGAPQPALERARISARSSARSAWGPQPRRPPPAGAGAGQDLGQELRPFGVRPHRLPVRVEAAEDQAGADHPAIAS